MPSPAEKLVFEHKAVTGKTEIYPGTYVISFQRDFAFTPGQCVALKLSNEDDYRIYSLCSGNQSKDLDILFNVNPEGSLTPRLAKLQPGDKVLVSNPFGNFFSPKGETWWLAAGTGIAPFMSMAASELAANNTLIHGAPVSTAFYFSNLLSVKVKHYVRCCSREKPEGYYHGRVTSWLSEQTELPGNVNYMICGSAEFVIDVRDVLIEKGIRYDKIIAEIYF